MTGRRAPDFNYQPRWLICAQALAIDPADLTGYQYLRWLNPLADAYIAERGGQDRINDHDDFDRWLASRAGVS